MVVHANIAVDGQWFGTSSVAEGGANGTFVLRNAFGPRVLRFGYRVVPGSPWWVARVRLDGKDVTDVPTDFSRHEQGDLEVVFTQHPARITGTVSDAAGQPARAPWILVAGSGAGARQPWSMAANAARASESGRFSVLVPPGRYSVHALPAAAFASWTEARDGVARLTAGGVAVSVNTRETQIVQLSLEER
jgi:hypothetical protein